MHPALKLSKGQRLSYCRLAREYASKGQHDLARRTFALVGISYVTPNETALIVAGMEGN